MPTACKPFSPIQLCDNTFITHHTTPIHFLLAVRIFTQPFHPQLSLYNQEVKQVVLGRNFFVPKQTSHYKMLIINIYLHALFTMDVWVDFRPNVYDFSIPRKPNIKGE